MNLDLKKKNFINEIKDWYEAINDWVYIVVAKKKLKQLVVINEL